MQTILKVSVAALLAATATYALAHEGHQETTKTVIIKEVHGEGQQHAHAGMAKCSGAPEVDVTDDKKGDGGKLKRSRVVICSDGKHGAEVVQHLEKARERIAKQDELSAEARAKALAALDAAIARHRKN